jgi:hypothetical protein
MTNANETQSFSSLDNTGIAENDLVHDDVMSVFSSFDTAHPPSQLR